jgi:hypothetical protein
MIMSYTCARHRVPDDRTGGCRDSSRGFRTLAQIVADYIERHRPNSQADIDFYAGQSSLNRAIDLAAKAQRHDGTFHGHQNRVGKATMARTRTPLLAMEVKGITGFDALHEAVDRAIRNIPRVGDLAIYDTAIRLGAFLGMLPERVYLHRGTRDGAKALGLNHKASSLTVADLPPELRQLRPYEVEDCLCIYKAEFAAVRRL